MKANTELKSDFIIVVRRTDRLLGELQVATWQRSPHTDADFEGQFSDQPESDTADPDQIGFFDCLACRYRVFGPNMGIEKWSPAEVGRSVTSLRRSRI